MTGSDRKDSAESRDRAAEQRDRGADHRDRLVKQELQAAVAHDKVLAETDQIASEDDQHSADDDQLAADADFAAGGENEVHDRGVTARKRSGRARKAVADDREANAVARLQGEANGPSLNEVISRAKRDRARAADDREEAAEDREEAASELAQVLGESEAAAQRALETLESMSDAFFTIDSEWRFTYMNPQTEVILERPRKDLIGKKMWDEFPEGVNSRFDLEYRRALRDNVPVTFEERYEPLGRIIEVRVFPVPAGLAVYFRDVTEIRRRESHQREASRLEAIGQVTASVAHDFNNLLAVVKSFAELGQRDARDEKSTHYFDEIQSASGKAVELTRQLLTFGRKQQLAPAIVDLTEVVNDLKSLLRQMTPLRIKFTYELSAQPIHVLVDRSQLDQVLINLVVNSRDAIEKRGRITIKTTLAAPTGLPHMGDAPAGWLQVIDTGSGIPVDVLPRIFDPFFSTKPPETGTGLGLATIYGIVSQSHGEIFVSSEVGAGTTMTVGIPTPGHSDVA